MPVNKNIKYKAKRKIEGALLQEEVNSLGDIGKYA